MQNGLKKKIWNKGNLENINSLFFLFVSREKGKQSGKERERERKEKKKYREKVGKKVEFDSFCVSLCSEPLYLNFYFPTRRVKATESGGITGEA